MYKPSISSRYILYSLTVFLAFFFNLYGHGLADELSDKTDPSFVGENPPAPINSSFVGDISNSTDNDSFSGEDTHRQTEGTFVGTNEIKDDDSLFAGSGFDRAVKESKDAPFAGDKAVDNDSYGK